MKHIPTWEAVEEDLDAGLGHPFERGPAPNMDEKKEPTPFRVVVDGEVVEVDAVDAYDAVEKAQKVKEGQKRQSNKKR